MKRILIIEDNNSRINQFKENFTNAELTIVKTVDKAIKTIKKNKQFDYMFFDHDLGSGGDSITIVDWLLNHKNKIAPNVYVHSANPVGAQNILNKIPSARKAAMIWKKEVNFKKK
ncbi:MAG: hypothetical protein HQ541_04350 [Mariniphaga sp.]|nr:hypothetical protein [Mariniphaga sp.]